MDNQITKEFAKKIKEIIIRKSDHAYNQDWLKDLEKQGYIKQSREEELKTFLFDELPKAEYPLNTDYFLERALELIQILDNKE